MITALRPGGHLSLGDIVYAPITVHALNDDADRVGRVVHAILDSLTNRGVDLR